MANANKPTGLSPVENVHGGSWDGKSRLYYVPSTDVNAYAIGDPVASLTGAADANGVPSVTLATAGTGNAVRGCIIGWGSKEGLMADPSNLDITIIPATKTKGYYILVCDDPYTLFEVQTTAGNYTAADIGKNANLKSGTNNGFTSGWTLDDSVVSATGATIQCKIMGLARRLDNQFGLYSKLLVMINNHELKAGTAGV